MSKSWLIGGLARDQAGSTISTAVIWDPDGTPRLLSDELFGVGIEPDETVLLTVEAFTPTGLLLGAKATIVRYQGSKNVPC